MAAAYRVLGLGQPLIDKVVRVEAEVLKELGLETGGSQRLLQEELEALLEKIKRMQRLCANKKESSALSLLKVSTVPGGSCANTIKALAGLGEKCAIIGKIGKDEMGNLYKQRLSQRGVIPLLTESISGRTGEVVCLITPDAQRTMRAFLGASVEMTENDLVPQDFKGIKLLHLEGYCIYNLPLMMKAMQLAKQHGALISYDLGSFELVRNFKDLLISTILPNFVDVVFCNEEEARHLVNSDAEIAVDLLSQLCHVAIVMLGDKGCWVRSKDCKYRCPTMPVQALDTTGAGDVFAAGFLYAFLQGYTLEQCARLGALAGREVVQVVGAEIVPEAWGRLKLSVNSELFMAKPTVPAAAVVSSAAATTVTYSISGGSISRSSSNSSCSGDDEVDDISPKLMSNSLKAHGFMHRVETVDFFSRSFDTPKSIPVCIPIKKK